MPLHSATLSSDEADTFAVLVSSLAGLDDQDTTTGASEFTVPVVDLLDHFAVLHDPRDQRWVEHPAPAVLTLCAAAVVAGMRSFTAIAGWVADTPPDLLHQIYHRCGKPALVPSRGTCWKAQT